MTLEEKIGQMTQLDISLFMDGGEVNYTKMRQWMTRYKFGSVLNSPFSGGPINGLVGWNASQWRSVIVNIQNIAMELDNAIPIIYGLDSIHGATYVYGAALFPQAINVAATFNTDMAYTSGLISGKDTRAAGVPWLFAPVLGLGIQPLWPRFAETFGEDAYLAAQMGGATIRGMQSTDNEYPGIPTRAAACMKHFIGYSDPYNGHDRSPVQLSDRVMRQLYLPSFQAAVDAGVLSAMESYNDLGGVPMVSSYEYLNKLLRLEMGFEGMMVSLFSPCKVGCVFNEMNYM